MESYSRIVDFLFLVALTIALLTISALSAFRLDDINVHGTLRQIPLQRKKPDGGFGFLRKTDSQQFDKELRELYDDFHRVRRSVDDAVRSHNGSIIDEFELKGDNHTVAFLHWAGKKSPYIYIYTCGKINQTQSDHTLCEDAYFWRSKDYGSTFKREDGQFKTKAINNVEFCDSNHGKVFVSALSSKTLYISKDYGEKFVPYKVPFIPHVISCNPQSENLVVGHDIDNGQVYYSSNGGAKWTPLSGNVVRHNWLCVSVDIQTNWTVSIKKEQTEKWGYKSSSEVFLEVKTGTPYTSVLKHATLPCGDKCVRIFDKSLGHFVAHSFEVAGKYMFVQKDLATKQLPKGLYVFYNNNSNLNSGIFFQHARFPLGVEEKDYKVVDASESEMMVVVRHDPDHYNLYVSDEMGVKYSLSLANILSDKRKIWGKMTTLVDIYRVESLPGTYLANVVFGDQLRSVISFNKGGEWQPLQAPAVDHRGIKTDCHPPQCSLHIHIVLSQWLHFISGVVSSSSAVGIIIAQGNLGESLGRGEIGVFMSNDGGLTWTKEFDSFYDFVIGDHGGILAAVSMWRDVKEVWYSCTEGKTWKNVTLDNSVRVYGMVTEPGETTLIVNLFGQYSRQKFQWLSVKLNFTSVLGQKCQADNYTDWSPNDERVDGKCLLGQHLVYERRKSGDCCFNGMEYEREINVTACMCEMDDFECDFGFEHVEFGEACMATDSVNLVPEPCPEGKTYQHSHGYRKVVGDKCVGGVEYELKPEARPCPVTAPKGLRIKLKGSSKFVEIHKPVNFNLSQEQGSTESTNYTWDFGDGSPLLNVTGLRKARRVSHTFNKHGPFVVTVTAANKAGQFVVTAGIQVLDPITSLEIDPPHAVVVGEEAWFNITIHSNHMDNPEEYSPKYGFVHFMWTFEENLNMKPVLVWKHEVSHTFSTPGQFKVTVQAISYIGIMDGHVLVTVHEEITTVRLSFDLVLDEQKQDTTEWRSWLAKRLQARLCQLLDVAATRLEVVVLRGTPTQADVSITSAPGNDSKTRQEIVDLLKKKVAEGVVEIPLPSDVTVRITNVEVLPDRGFGSGGDPSGDEQGSGGLRLAIGIGIGASLVVICLVVTLIYFLRRYNRLQSRYTHLRLYSDGGELRDRDPLIADETETEDEQALHPQPGGTLRYIPVPTSTEPEPDSDEELIDNFQGGTLVVTPGDQNGQVQGGNLNA